MSDELIFKDRILDNVHGFINYTEAEGKIINTLLFKRLQSIKQLSLADWVFPGSEHTRFIHSLGGNYVPESIHRAQLCPARKRGSGLLEGEGHC